MRCGRKIHDTTSDRCDRVRGHLGICCPNRWHPSGCGSTAGVPRDYLYAELHGAVVERQLAGAPATERVSQHDAKPGRV